MPDSLHGVESDPAVAGGDPCIIRTRIPVWTLVRARSDAADRQRALGPKLTEGGKVVALSGRGFNRVRSWLCRVEEFRLLLAA